MHNSEMGSPVKIFALKVLLAALPFIALFTHIEYRARHLPNTYQVKKQGFEQLKDSIAVLVLGSSHALKGIDPSLFSCTGFNFSNSSQTLIQDEGLCHRYLNELPQLKAVVLDISYISFYFDLQDSPESWRDYFYWHYYGLNDPPPGLLKPETYFYSALYTQRVVNDIFFGKLNYIKEFGNISPYGWEITHAPEDSLAISDSIAGQLVSLHEELARPANFHRVMDHLDRLLCELEKRDIAVLMVSLPVSRPYYSQLDPVRENRIGGIIDSLRSEHPLVYRDYSRDPRFGRTDFSDCDHLDSTGAVKFSRILDEELLSRYCVSGP